MPADFCSSRWGMKAIARSFTARPPVSPTEPLAALADPAAARRDFQVDLGDDPDWWMIPGGAAPPFWLRRFHQVNAWVGRIAPLHRPALRQSRVEPLLLVRVDDFPR